MNRTQWALYVLLVCMALFAVPAHAGQDASPVALLTPQEAVALARADVQGVLTECELDTYRGALVYSLEFLDADGNQTEIRLHAVSGKILMRDTDREDKNEAAYLATITMAPEDAEALALSSVPESVWLSTSLDARRDGAVFEVELADEQGVTHEIHIEPKRAIILSSQQDSVRGQDRVALTPSQAGEKAVSALGGGFVARCVLDDDGSTPIYEILAADGEGIAYEIEVNAESGAILKQKRGS